ncbi:MAG: AcrB/AcrD/AcrF family protein [Alphaproteobacteria bacterium]|jgi:multidrug efflux pump subunit AcrB|nr:AcrB/AcrD/AcrF family protein [Alphaproteobacteria bacterium]
MSRGPAGRLTAAFIDSAITPLMLIAALVAGLIAFAALPREEEPQIRVPLVDVHVRADGLQARDAVELVTEPLEDIIAGIDDVEHVYSETADDRVTVTARFFVGTDEDDAILRVHETVRANFDRIPLGIPEPLIVGRGINDVAIIVVTLAPDPAVADRWTDNDLYDLADELLFELRKVEDVGLTYLVGGRPDQIRVEPDPERLSLYGITLNRLVEKVEEANRSFRIGRLRTDGRTLEAVAGQTLQGVPDIGLLVLSSFDGRPVYVRDVADIVVGAAPEESRVWHIARSEAEGGAGLTRVPAVSIALAKRQGANATVIADRIRARLDLVQGRIVPEGIRVSVTRDYGETAGDKSASLTTSLVSATAVIVLFIGAFVGPRAGVVVLIVIPTSILLTLFWAWLLDYTINRVSLFALIFSIGILVDDAIVVIENIARHWAMGDDRPRLQAAVEAVDEVGNPTIISTLTIIAALLPMMFVSGLMGPYMSPIPANASAAIVFSTLVALTITPWLMLKLGTPRAARVSGGGGGPNRLGRAYLFAARPVLKGRLRPALFLLAVLALTAGACLLFVTRDVTVKLLPFDNKSELQVLVDLPEGASVEDTDRVLAAAAERVMAVPEVSTIQAHAGTAAPFNFNGLVRHYYLRQSPELGDLQVNLVDKDARDRQSHAIALEVRRILQDLPVPAGTVIKVVEVPPGPPVLATLLAEIYGPDRETRRAAADRVRDIYEAVPFIVDVDDSLGEPADRLRFVIDQDNLEFHGVTQQAVYDTLQALLGGTAIGYSHRGEGRDPIEIVIRLPKSQLAPGERLLATPVPAAARTGAIEGVVELGDVVHLERIPASYPIFRRNGQSAVMVMGELAGAFEAPIYGMLAVAERLEEQAAAAGGDIAISLYGQPSDESFATLLWDGEWHVTYVTFRDMGLAFGVALLAIYLILVAQFGHYRLPLLVMAPVPLTLLGIVLGHWALGAAFTATSMIGFIALAGIVIRNAILLIEFVRQFDSADRDYREVVLEAGAVRFTPIVLTAVTSIIGALFILPDPIFEGLAVSLIFGLASSTILTVMVVPAFLLLGRRQA